MTTDNSTVSIYRIPEIYKIKFSNVNFITLDKVLTTHCVDFELDLELYGVMPNYKRLSRLDDFFKSLDSAVFMSYMSDMTPVFLTGSLDNITIEVPLENFSYSDCVQLIRMKAESLLGIYASIVNFTHKPVHNPALPNISYSTDLDMIDTADHFNEEQWMEDIQATLDDDESTIEADMGNGKTELLDISLPWWRSDDGRTRDFIHGIPANLAMEIVNPILDLTDPSDMDSVIKVYYDHSDESIKDEIQKVRDQINQGATTDVDVTDLDNEIDDEIDEDENDPNNPWIVS